MPNKKKAKSNGNGAGREQPEDAVELLAAQHERIRSAAEALGSASDDAGRRAALQQLATLWSHYSDIEHEVAFKAYGEAGVDEQALAEATIGHDLVAILLRSLLRRLPSDQAMRAGVAVLGRLLEWRSDDTGRTTTLHAAATDAGVDMKALGRKLKDRLSSLEHDEADEPTVPHPRLLRVAGAASTSMEERMRTRGRERDEQGRYTPEDDDRRGMRPRRDDDERDRSSRSLVAPARGRDDHGRFTQEDDDRSYSSRSRRDDDDDRGRRSGGWFGDREGHSRAAERGWDDRRSSGRYDDDRSSRHDDDDRRRSSSSRRDDDDDVRRWSAGYRRDDDDEGPGWHGDAEGHAEAARKGWEHRRMADDDDGGRGRSSARSRDDDDDRDRGRSGGWFGDREGHSRVAQHGWDERRSASRQDAEERSSVRDDEDDDRRRQSRRRHG